ncbi:hypothetical protein [Flavobacterium hydatis]|jgi:hypothetical protein|uniref:Lipoprotein n=1 Tax=Flavobacterium hydatis TaxID=991 RepID=A0A085ZZU4_FLAHY|nr:hypothetical protein [Flavobacterium hydatis]KFF09958.1 hypothetical protein IW20_21950 [Flavobacterium hydatis]OXA95295.1 hypothetical protein B0A62_08275 [Flavobacterium hydatis]
MKKVLYLFIAGFITLTSCSSDNDLGKDLSATANDPSRVINTSGSADGVTYKLQDLAINPDLTKLSSENATITSSATDMEKGKFEVETSSSEMSEKLISGNLIYLTSDSGKVYFRKISNVIKNNNSYSLETTEAYIGDLFQGGSIELSMDVQENEKALRSKKTSLLTAKGNYDNSFTYDIFNNITEYKSNGFNMSPNTSVNSVLSMKIGFGKSKLLPNEIEVYYQINSAINPYFNFAGAVNKKYTYNLIDNVPANILDLLKKVSIDVTIPAGDLLGDIPAKISIDEIAFPMEVEANLSKSSHFAINSNGIFKIGFAYYNGIPGKKSHFIYENTITNSKITEGDLAGEVSTDMKISIKPKIQLLDSNILDVKGNIVFGINSFTIGNGSLSQPSAFASTGNFYSSGTFSFGALGLTVYTTELFKENKQLWNTGSFAKTMTVSNFRSVKTSSLPCSGLYSYGFDVTLDYKYPITGKTLSSGNLEVTYDVYSDTGTVLETAKKVTVAAKDITANSFKFNLCIPFRKINILSVAKTSNIKNITIKDANGYIATGVINPATNSIYPQMTVTK